MFNDHFAPKAQLTMDNVQWIILNYQLLNFRKLPESASQRNNTIIYFKMIQN